MLGKTEGRRRRGWQRMRWLEGITDSIDEFEQVLGIGDGQGGRHAAVHGVAKSQTWLSNWTELNWGWGFINHLFINHLLTIALLSWTEDEDLLTIYLLTIY